MTSLKKEKTKIFQRSSKNSMEFRDLETYIFFNFFSIIDEDTDFSFPNQIFFFLFLKSEKFCVEAKEKKKI